MFEVGEGYKLRNGCEAKVYAVYPYSVHGAYFDPVSKKWASHIWDVDGEDDYVSGFKLLPKNKVGWINIYRDVVPDVPYAGDIHPSKEKALTAIKDSLNYIATIKIEYHEGQVDDE